MPIRPPTRLTLVALLFLLVPAGDAQAQGCGYAHRKPQGGQIGTAPLAIGDSVMLGAARRLSNLGFEVDARCARTPPEGLSIIRQRRSRGTLPEVVVIALGTNVVVSRGDIRRMLRAAGRRRTLMLVTPFRQWRPFHTRPMRRVARHRPKRVKLIDWSGRAERDREWFIEDGTHLRPDGVRVYTRMLKRAGWARLRGRFGR